MLPTVIDQNSVLAELGIKKFSLSAKEAEDTTGVKPNRYFPFIQLLQKTSKDVGTFKAGEFILKTGGKDKDPKSLGTSFDAVVIAVRGKATYFDGKLVKAEYHTAAQKTPGYDDMVTKSKADAQSQTYRAGLDVLLWVPQLSVFAIFFANSQSAISQVEKEFCPLQDAGTAAKIFSEFKEGSKGSWFLPRATELGSEIEGTPPQDLFKEAVKTFVFPVASVEDEIEGAEKADSTSTR